MLGRSVSDPDGVEAAGLTQIRGLGLLDMDTVFHGEKVQRQTAGTFSGVQGLLSGLNGLGYEGYEIHMGQSASAMPPLAGSGSVYGSYIHGVSTRRASPMPSSARSARAAGSTRRPSAASMRRPTRSGSTTCWRTPSVRASIWTTSTASCTGRHKQAAHPPGVPPAFVIPMPRYPSATSSTIIRLKPMAKKMVPTLVCVPCDISGISSSTTT